MINDTGHDYTVDICDTRRWWRRPDDGYLVCLACHPPPPSLKDRVEIVTAEPRPLHKMRFKPVQHVNAGQPPEDMLADMLESLAADTRGT
tara:strand:+ start:221 stop:490 length:270 start_codon:yes stop_codon:yes gene_type:complete